MIAFHQQAGVPATMGLYRVPDPWNRGVVQLDEAGTIIRFEEKPSRNGVFSNLANAGIYVLEPEILARIPSDRVYDFGHDLFPGILADGMPVAGYVIDELLIDIGLPEKYEEANQMALTATANSQGT
jgi:mannose-1-phosphate guanylyltransferase/phosphomannomutase